MSVLWIQNRVNRDRPSHGDPVSIQTRAITRVSRFASEYLPGTRQRQRVEQAKHRTRHALRTIIRSFAIDRLIKPVARVN